MSDPRIWIKGAGGSPAEPQFLVTRPGYTVEAPSIPNEGIAFNLAWQGAGTLYLAGSVLVAAMAGNVVVTFPDDLGYVPVSRVIGVTNYSDGKISNVIVTDVITFSDRIEVFEKSRLVQLYYFVFTARTA